MNRSVLPHVLLVSALSMAAGSTFAEQPGVVVPRFEKALEAQAMRVASIPDRTRSASCSARYERIWAQDRLRIDWFYGYLQSEKADIVSDRLVRYTTVHALMKPCREGVSACGFTKAADLTDEDGPIVLEKDLGAGRSVEIRLWNSAKEDWNSKNTIGLLPVAAVPDGEQKRKSKKVWKAFLQSFREAPIVIYDGHSEVGKGPGFRPMSWLDYALDALRGGPKLKKVMKSLREPGPRPEVFMIAACESKKYYLQKYRAVLPQTAIVATDRPQEFAVGEATVFAFVDSILAGRCEAGIEEALVPVSGNDAGAHIYGFEMEGL